MTHDDTQKQTIAYLGIPGSFSFLAAKKIQPREALLYASRTVREVFSHVQEGRAEKGVVPLENSLHGNVVESFDLLAECNLSLIGEMYLKIHHCIVGIEGTDQLSPDLRWATRCFSHWQAISQCEPFFSQYPWIQPIFSSDTATAAKEIALAGKTSDIAISGIDAATRYGLTILKHHAEKDSNNFTRFGVISKTPNKEGEKITLTFSVKHVPGSLLLALTPYAMHGLNLMQIESRPKQGSPWEYNFFVDLEIGSKKESAEQAIIEMKKNTHALHILGRYQKGPFYET